MNTDYTSINKSIGTAASAKLGQITRPELVRIGKEASTTMEKISLFFKTFLRPKAAEKRENYYYNVGANVITERNITKLDEKVAGINPQEKIAFLYSLEPGEELLEESPHLKSIQTWIQGFRLIKQASTNPDLHWLKSFAKEDDLGEKLELIDLYSRKEQLVRLNELDQLHQASPGTHFIPLLQFILDKKKLREITQEQLDDFKSCLEVYGQLPKHSGEDRLKPATTLFTLLKTIEREKEVEARQQFQTFLKGQPEIQDLLSRLPPGSVDKILSLQVLVPQLSRLPADFYFSTSVDDMIAKIEAELPVSQSETLVARFGQKFAANYGALPDKTALSGLMAKLQKVEEDYRLCDRSGEFIQLINEGYGKGGYDVKGFAKFIDDILSKNALSFHLYAQLAERTKTYVRLRIPPEQIISFQNKVIDEAGPKSKEFFANLVGNKGALDKKIGEIAAAFNKEQLDEAKQDWSKYGKEITDLIDVVLRPEVKNGMMHYKEKDYEQLLSNLTEIDKTAAAFNIAYVKAEFGPALASHFMGYLLSPEGKKLMEENPGFLTKEWPSVVQKLKEVKSHFLSKGVSAEQFNDAINKFLSKSLYSQAQFIHPDALSQFSQFLQYDLTEKKMRAMEESHGRLFMDSLIDYLKENEPDVLSGKESLEETLVFQATSFEDQMSFLKPYLLKNLQPLGVLDEEFAASVLFSEPLNPQILQIRLDNLNRLKELGKDAKTPREATLIKAFIPALASPYLINLDEDYTTESKSSVEKGKIMAERKQVQESVSKLVKFCSKEIDKQEIYSPDLLARAVLELLQIQGKGADSPLKTLKDAAEKCDAVFNGDVIKEFQAICFRLYVEDAAKAVCEKEFHVYQGKIAQLIEGLLARFSKQDEGLTSPDAAAYIRDMVSFVVNLSLSTSIDNFKIIESLVNEVKPENIFFNVHEIHKRAKAAHAPLMIPEMIKEKITKELKTSAGAPKESAGILAMVEKKPFAVVNAFLPRFIENLLADEDKEKVKDIREALAPLGPYFNQSLLVAKGLGFLNRLLPLIQELMAPDSAKNFLVEKIEGFNALDLDEMGKLNDLKKIDKDLNNKGLGLWMSVAGFFGDKLIDAHAKMTAPAEAVQEAALLKEAEKDSFVEFISTTLPKLVEDRKSITNWIKRIAFIIPIIRKIGGGWFANQILKRYIAAWLDKVETLDKPTKKLIIKSMDTIIQTVLLASPALLEKHNIEGYLNFLEHLNDLMQNKEQLDKNALFIELLKTIQQLTRELAAYGPLLEDAMNHTLEQIQAK